MNNKKYLYKMQKIDKSNNEKSNTERSKGFIIEQVFLFDANNNKLFLKHFLPLNKFD